MKKSIEEQIAEGVAKGIQKAKEQEIDQKRNDAIRGAISIVFSILFVAFSVQIFGESKTLLFVGGSFSFLFSEFLIDKKNLKKYPILMVFGALMWGFLLMKMV